MHGRMVEAEWVKYTRCSTAKRQDGDHEWATLSRRLFPLPGVGTALYNSSVLPIIAMRIAAVRALPRRQHEQFYSIGLRAVW